MRRCCTWAVEQLGDGPYTAYAHKGVKLCNFRLSVLEKLLYLGVIAGIIVNFTFNRHHLLSVEPEGFAVLWGSGNADSAQLSDAQLSDLEKEFCRSPSTFDYMYDLTSDPSSNYVNNSCLPLCIGNTSRTEGACSVLDPCSEEHGVQLACHEAVRMFEYNGDSMYVPTHLQLVSGRMTRPVDANYFLVGVDAITVKLRTTFKVGGRNRSGTCSNLMNVVKFANGTELRRYRPDESWDGDVELTISEALDLAGLDLDSVEVDPGKNVLEGAVNEGVLTRIAGAKLELQVSVIDSHGYQDWSGPVCELYVQLLDPFQWTPKVEIKEDLGSFASLLYRYHGIRLTYKVTGSFSYVDAQSIILNLAASITFLGIPSMVITFIARYALGRVSKVYARRIDEPLDLQAELAGTAMRLLAWNETFDALTKKNPELSKSRFGKMFRKFFEDKEQYRESHLVAFTDFVFRNAAKLGEQLNRQDTFPAGLAWYKRGSEEVPDSSVTAEEYCAACVSNETVQVRTLVSLFTEPLNFRERFFMERTVRLWRQSTQKLSQTLPEAFFTRSSAGTSTLSEKSEATLGVTMERTLEVTQKLDESQEILPVDTPMSDATVSDAN